MDEVEWHCHGELDSYGRGKKCQKRERRSGGIQMFGQTDECGDVRTAIDVGSVTINNKAPLLCKLVDKLQPGNPSDDIRSWTRRLPTTSSNE